MPERCGSTETTTGEPCQNGPNCPHHAASALSPRKTRAADLLREGKHRRSEIAEACGVTTRTLRRWTNRHEELAEAAREGDVAQFEEIRDAWFQRLVSGEHSASEIIFYMKNKSRLLEDETWQDSQRVEHSGPEGGPIEVTRPMSAQQKAERIEELLQQARAREGVTANGDGS